MTKVGLAFIATLLLSATAGQAQDSGAGGAGATVGANPAPAHRAVGDPNTTDSAKSSDTEVKLGFPDAPTDKKGVTAVGAGTGAIGCSQQTQPSGTDNQENGAPC
jgi:hypothetical protein